MSIVRTYLQAEEGLRPTHYREAWFLEGDQEFVIHHGKVGTSGTTVTEEVDDDQTGMDLLESFAKQCDLDGYVHLAPEDMEQLEVRYQLKSNDLTPVEKTLTEKLGRALTHTLAWHGLGEVLETIIIKSTMTYVLATVHPTKTRQLLPQAFKAAGIRTSKVSVFARK